jgi:hypothetical protein
MKYIQIHTIGENSKEKHENEGAGISKKARALLHKNTSLFVLKTQILMYYYVLNVLSMYYSYVCICM